MNKRYKLIDENDNKYPEWEQKKASEIFESSSRKGFEKLEVLSATQEKGILPRTLIGIDIKYDRNTLHTYKKVEVHDFIISLRSFQGGIETSDYEGIVSPAYTVFNFIQSPYFCSDFFRIFFKTKAFIIKLSTITFGIRDGKAISFKDFSTLSMPIPSLSEQQKIAEFFSALDERIGLTANKVKLLKEQKAGYLQQVFNRELGFTDGNGDTYADWEQKELGEIAEFVNGFAFKPYHLGDEGIPVVKIKELLDPSDLSVKTIIDVPKSLHLKNGDIVLSWSMTLACRIWSGGPAILNQHLYKVVSKENNDSGFINHLLNNELSQLRNLMHGGTAKHITRKDLLPYKVMMPSIPEQEKIAEFFSALDEQIELTENKLALLKEQKKGYLQGIFG